MFLCSEPLGCQTSFTTPTDRVHLAINTVQDASIHVARFVAGLGNARLARNLHVHRRSRRRCRLPSKLAQNVWVDSGVATILQPERKKIPECVVDANVNVRFPQKHEALLTA